MTAWRLSATARNHQLECGTPSRSHWFLVLVAVVVLTGSGVAAGLKRHAKYSSTATLAVLHVNLGAAGALSGFQTAAETLADTYARSVRADGVVNPLAARFHLPRSTIRAELSAVAVPSSPVFNIQATTASPGFSGRLADAASHQLVTYLQAINSSSLGTAPIYRRLQRAEHALTNQQANQAALKAAIAATPGTNMTSAERSALAAAQASVNVAQDQVNAISATYTQSQLGASSTQYVQQLASAGPASSDRRSKLVLLAFAGLAAGLALGVALAVLLGTRRRPVRAD